MLKFIINTSSEKYNGKVPKSYEELENIVNAWLNGDDEEESKESSRGWGNSGSKSESSSSTSSDDSPDAINSKYKSLDDAFADLDAL